MCLVDKFINNKIIEDAIEEHTQKKYRQELGRYFEYFSKKYNTEDELEIIKNTKRDDIDEFRDYLLINKYYAVSTVNGTLITLRQFDRYLTDRHIIEESFMNNVKEVKLNIKNKNLKPKKKKEIITPEEMNKLIACSLTKVRFQKDFNYNSVRNCFCILLLMSTGMRNDELVNITLDRIENRNGILFINFSKEHTKKDIPKTVPIVGKALEYYNKYIENRNELKTIVDKDYLLLSSNGEKLNTRDINRMISKYAKITNINKAITPHSCKKFFSAICNICNISEIICKCIAGWSLGGDMMSYYAKDNILQADDVLVDAVQKVLDFTLDKEYLKSVNF